MDMIPLTLQKLFTSIQKTILEALHMCNHRDTKNTVLIEGRGTISFPWPIVYN